MFDSLNKVDWDLLHQQKLVLLTMLEHACDGSSEAEALAGIINLLDALQDEAAAAGRWAFPGEAGEATGPRLSPPLRCAHGPTPSKRKPLTPGTLRWRCRRCGAAESTTDDPVELAQTGVPLCGACDQEMDPCETDLQPVLDALSRCAFVLFKIAAGDPQALGRAAEVAQAGVRLLRPYGEEDEWMSDGVAPEELAHGAEPPKQYYVEDDEGHHHGPMDDYEEAASVADAIQGRIIVQEEGRRCASPGEENVEGGA